MFSSTCVTATAAARRSRQRLQRVSGSAQPSKSPGGGAPLQWSQPLAKSASLLVRLQRDKHNCSFANLANSKYGGNQLWAGGFRVTPRAAVDTWVAEKKFYNYQDNSCAPDHRCGVYTQVVWKQSVELGCAQAGCAKDQSSLTICFYNPPGNIIGEKPY
ncbi:UNVERIFIED_CONTAM: STS14 protein [Sesamum calycinum]|uniref:STS14 protein n=1 Tax=Sesamum calycinum TaxID=2727403 RepID=A0AAW2ML79_9LAMI